MQQVEKITDHNFRHIIRYQKIQTRYHQLYNEKRVRIDDVMHTLENEFSLSQSRIKAIVMLRLPDPQIIDTFVKKNKPYATQLFLEM